MSRNAVIIPGLRPRNGGGRGGPRSLTAGEKLERRKKLASNRRQHNADDDDSQRPQPRSGGNGAQSASEWPARLSKAEQISAAEEELCLQSGTPEEAFVGRADGGSGGGGALPLAAAVNAAKKQQQSVTPSVAERLAARRSRRRRTEVEQSPHPSPPPAVNAAAHRISAAIRR